MNKKQFALILRLLYYIALALVEKMVPEHRKKIMEMNIPAELYNLEK